jgi:REP element-mobilizing transposase RayT
MSQGYQVYDQKATYFLTFQIVMWVDVFTRPEYKKIATDCFDFCRKKKGLELFGFVIMTNHIHLIARAKDGFQLSDIIRDYKKWTANQLLEKIKEPTESRSDWMLKRFEFAASAHQRNSHYQIWTHENHAVELHSHEFMIQKLNYIHENPVRAGIVRNAEEYIYSSASNYSGLESVLEIDLI